MKYKVEKSTKKSFNQQGIEDMGQYIDYPWKWFLHLTFAYNNLSNRKRQQKRSTLFRVDARQSDDTIKPERAKKLFKNFMRTVGRDVPYFVVIEWRPPKDAVHVHALIGETTKPIRWKHGVRQIKQYDPTRGARFYILKHLFTDHFDMALRMPRKPGRSKKIVL
jgi:hypothetical protein